MSTRRHLLTTALLLTPCLVAQKVNEVEPNDTPLQAQPITAGMHVACTYTTAAPTDDDWFSFVLTAPGQVHLHASAGGTLSLGLSRDNRIAIYDSTGTQRLAWNDGAVGSMADCGVTLPAGAYTAVVNLKSGGVAGNDYGLDFYVLPVNPIDTVEAAEPNDTPATATTFTLGDTIEGDLFVNTDVDYWRFTLTGRGIVQAASYDDGGIPQLDNVSLRFYQEVTPGLWSAMGSAVTNAASHRVTNLSHTGVLNAGTYAIEVQAGTTAIGTAPWDLVKTGKYSLRTCLIDMPGTNTVVEGPEPNNTPAAPAGAINLGDSATGFTTGNGGDGPDWYVFVVGGPTTVGAMAEGDSTPGTPLPGSTVRIWNSTGTTTLATASGNATTHGRLIYTIERAGVYYLEVSGAFAATSGYYRLHTGGCSPLYVSATTRAEPASTNACIGTNGLRPLLGYLSGETPAFGSTFITRVERALPSAPVGVFLGFSNTIAFGSVPLPAFLDFGGLDSQMNPTTCDVRVDPLAFVGVATDASGYGEYSINFPFALGDFGLKIFQQAACYDPTLNSFGVSLSNDASYVLGDRPF
ncbi:MAG: hypothetical protein JNM25_02335 [Planctomycetes bacterium]|nr:hypothetical protein [Planctomycetota bacterium]